MNQDRQALWVTDFSTSHTQVKGDTSELPEVMKDLVRLQRRLSLGPHHVRVARGWKRNTFFSFDIFYGELHETTF